MNLEDVLLRGTRAAQPLATVVAVGSLYYVTDEEATEQSNGSAWVTYSDISGGITTLTGDVAAGPGSGTQTATIANDAITFAKMQEIATNSLIGRDSSGTGNPETILPSDSLVFDGSQNLHLSGDTSAPGNYKYYGTNVSGTKGWNTFPPQTTDWDSVITKTTTDEVTDSTTFTSDSELSIQVLAGEAVSFEFYIVYSGNNATQDYKWRFHFTAGAATGEISHTGLGSADTSQAVGLAVIALSDTTSVVNGTDAVDGKRITWIRMQLTFTANTTINYQFAMNSGATGIVKTWAGSTARWKILFTP